MSTEINDGGPAFPVTVHQPYKKGVWKYGLPGISVRDHFAAKAMQSIITHLSSGESALSQCHPEIANEAYRIADAMLKAREEKTPVPKNTQ